MTVIYGAQVLNETLVEEYHQTHGAPADESAPVLLIDPLNVTQGFDPLNFPGQLDPATLRFSLFCRTGADVPAWEPGHVVRARICVPETWAGPGDWWATDPTTSPRPVDWVNDVFVIYEANAVPVQGGTVVTYTCVDPITAVTGLLVTLTRAAEDFASRAGAILDAISQTWGINVLGGRTVSLDLGNLSDQLGPVVWEAIPFGEIVDTLANSGVTDGSFGEDPGQFLVYNLEYQGTPDLFYGPGYLASSATGLTTAFRLVLVGTEAQRQTRPTMPDTSGGSIRNVLVDACHVPLDGVAWNHTRGINTVRLETIKADGSAGAQSKSYDDIARERGTLTRPVASQALHTTSKAAVLTFLLGDRAAAQPDWRPSAVTILTRALSAAELDTYAENLRLQKGYLDTARLVAQLVVTDVAEKWAVDGQDYIAGTLVRTTHQIQGGELRIGCEFVPQVPTPSGSGTDQAASYQDVLDAFSPDLRYQDSPAGSNHIDPDLTYADMQLTGV